MNNSTSPPDCQHKNLRLSPYQQACEYYTCSHLETEVRYKTYANNTIHYFAQCLNCGRSTGHALPHSEIANPDKVSIWDNRLENAYQYLIDEMANRLRDEARVLWESRQTEWDAEYNDYINSDQWKDKRRRVLERDDHLCQACLKRRAAEVHHTTYQYPFGKEPLFVLVSVCRLCHDALHEINPNSRPIAR